MAFAIAGIVTCLIFLSPIALVLGYIARKQIAARGEAGAEFATVGIVVGWIGSTGFLFVCVFWLIPLVTLLVNNF